MNQTPTNDAPVTVERELQPCPHCGNERIGMTSIRDGYEVWCKCGATMQAHNPNARQKAIDQWNMRHRLAALASAPAGDGYDKWHPMLLNIVNAIHGDRGEKTQAIGIDLSYQQALAAALARPHSAVAPADDGVEAALKFALTVKSELVERAPTYSIQSVEREHFDRAILAIAALARPRAAMGERAWDGVVATDPCQSADETDEDGNPCWFIEIQSVGGHSIVATLWGGSPEEVRSRADAILALQSPPAKVAGGCPSSPDGRHQVDTTMESGSNNCFHCEAPMGV